MKRVMLRGLCVVAVGLGGCKKKTDDAVGGGTASPPVAAAPDTTAAAPAPATPPDAGLGVFDADGGVAPTPAEFEAMMNRALTLTEAIGDAAARAGTDCGELAKALEVLMEDARPLFADFARYASNPEVDRQGDAWMAAHTDRLEAAMARARPALMACRADARIKAAFERLASMK